ncbi:MAG: hypothetical protein LBM67_01480 [Lentimicrobiaceae bacterium]|jgi:hypothetical protein|nr:hypothetical protein [Lentimicrobiaceae bacterium]
MEKKYNIIIEEYWNIMDKFGCLKDIVPDGLIELYKEYNFKDVHIGNQPIRLVPGHYNDDLLGRFNVNEVCLSRNIFAVHWIKPKSSWFLFSPNHYDRHIVTVRFANSSNELNFMDKDAKIIAVTNKYVALMINYKAVLFDSQGNQISTINQNQFNELFCKTESYNKFIISKNEKKLLGDISISLGVECKEYTEINPYYPDSGSDTIDKSFVMETVDISTISGMR